MKLTKGSQVSMEPQWRWQGHEWAQGPMITYVGYEMDDHETVYTSCSPFSIPPTNLVNVKQWLCLQLA